MDPDLIINPPPVRASCPRCPLSIAVFLPRDDGPTTFQFPNCEHSIVIQRGRPNAHPAGEVN